MSFFIFLISFFNLLGQSSHKIDSLIKTIPTQKKDTLKVQSLIELAFQYRKKNPKKAIEAATEALNLSDSLNYHRGRADSENRLGIAYKYQKKFEAATIHFTREFEISSVNKYRRRIGRSTYQLSAVYLETGKLDKALEYGLKAKEIYTQLNDISNLGLISNHLGNIYYEKINYEKAIENYLKGLNIRISLKDTDAIGYSYLSLGLVYKKIKNYSKSIEYHKLSLQYFERVNDNFEISNIFNNLGNIYKNLEKNDDAFLYFNKALKIKEKLEIADQDPAIYNNIGLLYYKMGNYEEALINYKKSLSISNKLNDKQGIADVSINLGNIYFDKKLYDESILYYETALKYATKLNSITHQSKSLKNLMYLHKEKGEILKAFKYSEKYILLNDSIDKSYRNTYLKLANFEENQKQNQLLTKNNEIAEAKNKEQQVYINSLIGGLVLTILLFFALFRINKQKQKVILAEKDKELEKQKSQEKLRQQELSFTNKMLEQQEKEQQRVAEDLHDRVGSLLSLVKIHLNSLKKHSKKISKAVESKFKKTNDIVDETCDEVRKIAYNMSSSVLSKFGLIAALEDLKTAIDEDDSMEFEFITHGFKDRLHDDLETIIYKTIQELLNNIIKHATASEITLQLIQSKEKINITLEDNGTGFDVDNQETTTSGMGLKNVTSRIYKINGDIYIDSVVRKGTTITIDIPLNI